MSEEKPDYVGIHNQSSVLTGEVRAIQHFANNKTSRIDILVRRPARAKNSGSFEQEYFNIWFIKIGGYWNNAKGECRVEKVKSGMTVALIFHQETSKGEDNKAYVKQVADRMNILDSETYADRKKVRKVKAKNDEIVQKRKKVRDYE